jgi:RNA polymerase sigma-32 factor
MNKQYQNYIMSLKTLEADEERKLILEYKTTGSQKAKNILVNHFMKLIIKMAKDIKAKLGNNDPENGLDDLISDGVIGFLIAIDKFDTTKISNNMSPDAPIRISTYAKWWIRVFIYGNAMNRKSKIYKLGSGKMKGVYLTVPRMMSENGWESPLKYEHAITIANHIGHGVTPEEVISMDRLRTSGDLSLDAKTDYGTSIIDTISNSEFNQEEQLEIKQMRQLLFAEINIECKDNREKDILINKTFSEMPVDIEDLAVKYQCSKERIRQIEKDSSSRVLSSLKIKLRLHQG